MRKMTELALKNKRVMIREDFNVPLKDGAISSTVRIDAALPSIKYALQAGAAVILLSHLGRPKAGKPESRFSLAPIANYLSQQLNIAVPLIEDWQHEVHVKPGEVVLCENVRFLEGEKENDAELAKQLAALCDIFVMDAFSVSHRQHVSTYGIAQYAQQACAGPLLLAELHALNKALKNAPQPMVAIVGGSKVSTKLSLLESLLDKVSQLIVGGGIANTFLAAAGHNIGKSLHEPDLIATAKLLIEKAASNHTRIPLPKDVVVAKEFSERATATIKNVNEVQNDEMILDIGPETANHYADLLKDAGTIIWNGPVGVFEFEAFQNGTKCLAEAIANSGACSLAGGGDTLAAIDKYAVRDKISYVSTGGGAFLQYLQGDPLPAVEIL